MNRFEGTERPSLEVPVVLFVAVLVLCTQVPAWLVLGRLVRRARNERRTRATWERATDARLAGHDTQLGNVSRALALLAPADARPTVAHRSRLVGEPLLPPRVAEPATPASRPSPRMRVDIRPSGFASDRLVPGEAGERWPSRRGWRMRAGSQRDALAGRGASRGVVG